MTIRQPQRKGAPFAQDVKESRKVLFDGEFVHAQAEDASGERGDIFVSLGVLGPPFHSGVAALLCFGRTGFTTLKDGCGKSDRGEVVAGASLFACSLDHCLLLFFFASPFDRFVGLFSRRSHSFRCSSLAVLLFIIYTQGESLPSFAVDSVIEETLQPSMSLFNWDNNV